MEFGQKTSLHDVGSLRIADPEKVIKGQLPVNMEFRYKKNLKVFKARLKMWQEDIEQGTVRYGYCSGQKIKGWVE